MADLITFEKHPDSWRVDHPNYGDVAKTTYAVGKITDFEVVSFYRIRVRSMVKVSGDWGESDYLPLFYHPKPQFWDDPKNGKLATDYNAGGYFEKAWMSFRIGDEVKVMLKEGVPAAVVGFADGVPRIGENLIRIKTLDQHNPIWTWFYDAIIIFQCDPPDVYFIGGNSSSTSLYYPPISTSENGPDGSDLKLVEPIMLFREVAATSGGFTWGGLFERFIVVGPILYIFSFWINTRGYSLNIRAAVYSDDLFNSIKDYPMISEYDLANIYSGSGYTGTPYPGTYLQNEFRFVVWQVVSDNMPGNSPPASNTWCQWILYDMTVRPHTKAELQAAGMWLAGAV